MRSLSALTAAASLLLVAAVAPPATADSLTADQASIDSATFDAATPDSTAPLGVSPEVFYDEASETYYLLTTSMPPTQYRSANGIDWVATTTTLPQGIDWSIVQEGPDSYRLYYAEMAPTAPGAGPQKPCVPKSKVLRYATSTDLQTWTTQPGVLLDDVGCGVPHVMKTRAGEYFLYFNKGLPVHGVYISTSADGLSWSTPEGPINNDTELVDPAPLEMPDGTFVMVGSTTGGKGQYQHLQLLASSDAVHWVKRSAPLYAPAGAGAFDPSIELINDELRVWFGYSPAGSYDTARITHGTLTLGADSSTPSLEMTCVKAKVNKKLGVKCSGTATGLGPAEKLTASIKTSAKGSWKVVSRSVTVASDGSFTWTARVTTSKYAWARVSAADVTSTEVKVRLK